MPSSVMRFSIPLHCCVGISPSHSHHSLGVDSQPVHVDVLTRFGGQSCDLCLLGGMWRTLSSDRSIWNDLVIEFTPQVPELLCDCL
eukprot:5198785-Amphidinium_carterae.1